MKKYRCLYLALMLTFILGVQDGKIALWKNGEPKPLQVFPYQAQMLPPEAQSALEKGVPIESLEQLEELAESYLS